MHRIFVVVVCNRLCSRLSASSPHKKVFSSGGQRKSCAQGCSLLSSLSLLSLLFCLGGFGWKYGRKKEEEEEVSVGN